MTDVDPEVMAEWREEVGGVKSALEGVADALAVLDRATGVALYVPLSVWTEVLGVPHATAQRLRDGSMPARATVEKFAARRSVRARLARSG